MKVQLVPSLVVAATVAVSPAHAKKHLRRLDPNNNNNEVTPDTLSWGLDRLDQGSGTDDSFFVHDSTHGDYNGNQAYNGEGVHVCIVDTGLDGSRPDAFNDR